MNNDFKTHPAVSDLFAQIVYTNYDPQCGELDEELLIEMATTFLDTLSELTVIAGQTAPEALVADFFGLR